MTVAEVVYLERAAAARRPAATAAVTPHLRTWRPCTMFYVGMVGLAGALLADPAGSTGRLCGAWLVPTLGWVASHYGADHIARDPDAVSMAHRPVPSGRMRPDIGLVGMVTCASAGGILAVALNWRTVLLVAAALLAGLAYSALLRAHGLAGNVVRGGLASCAFLFGAMAVRPYPASGVLVVAGVFLLHDTAANLVGTLRDVDGDRRSGYPTFPVRHGVAVTLAVVVVLCVSWLALAAVAPVPVGMRVGGRPVFWGLLGLAAVLAGAALVTLVRAGPPLTPRRALRAHEILTLERLVLACAFVGLAAGLVVALAVLLPAGVLSVLLSVSMRSRHEPGSGRHTAAPGGGSRSRDGLRERR